MVNSQQLQNDVADAIAKAAGACGLDVVAWTLKPAGGDFRVEVLADRHAGAGGITLDDCATLSLAAQSRLDAIAGFAERYEIEVSSPGIDRPLRHLDDCVRFAGVDVKVTFLDDRGQLQTAAGTLVGVDTARQAVALQPPVAKGKPATAVVLVAWSNVRGARLSPTLAQWQALGARLAAETPAVSLDQTGGADCDGDDPTKGTGATDSPAA